MIKLMVVRRPTLTRVASTGERNDILTMLLSFRTSLMKLYLGYEFIYLNTVLKLKYCAIRNPGIDWY